MKLETPKEILDKRHKRLIRWREYCHKRWPENDWINGYLQGRVVGNFEARRLLK